MTWLIYSHSSVLFTIQLTTYQSRVRVQAYERIYTFNIDTEVLEKT